MISVSSIFFAGCAGMTLAGTAWTEEAIVRRVLWFASAMFIQLRLIANLLDGMVAIEGGKESAVGQLYNEVPDRVSDFVILVGAGFAIGGNPLLGMTAVIVALFVAYVRAMGSSVGVGEVFVGPMAKPQRMAVMTIISLYGAVTPIAWQPEGLGSMGLVAVALLLIIIGGIVTAIRRLSRIACLMRETMSDSQ